jgi:hypothetical protein
VILNEYYKNFRVSLKVNRPGIAGDSNS